MPKKNAKRPKKKKVFFLFFVYIFLVGLMGVFYFLSSLSYVSDLKVEGNENVSAKEITDSLEINNKTRYWPNNFAKNVDLLKKKQEKINKVTIQRKFPNKLLIKVSEYVKVAYLLHDNKLYPVLSNGTVLKKELEDTTDDMPILVNWKEGKELQEISAELRNTPKDATAMISEIRFEPNKINPLRIVASMTNGYEVYGNITGFSTKISAYPAIAPKIPEGVKGIIDMEVGYVLKPYQQESEETKGNDGKIVSDGTGTDNNSEVAKDEETQNP